MVVLLLLLGESVAVAPGDEDRECDSLIPMPHSSIKVLLKSWRYKTLLPENSNAAWTTNGSSEHSQEPLVSGQYLLQ